MSHATLKQALVLSSAALMLLACCPFAVAQTIEYTEVPGDLQVYPRDLVSNTATVDVSGTVITPGYDAVQVMAYRAGVPISSQTQALVYVGGPTGATLTVTSGLQMWLDADNGVQTDGGSAVTNWTDQSGNGNHAIPAAVANQPQQVADVVNGHSTVRFDGADDALVVGDTNTFEFLHNGEGATVFMVFNVNPGGLQVVLDTGADSGGNVGYTFGPDNRFITNALYDVVMAGGTVPFTTLNSGTYGNEFPPNEWTAAAHSFTNGAPADDVNVYKNGARIGGRDVTSAPATGPSTRPLVVGAMGSGAFYLGGDIAEVLVYDRVLADGEREAVDAYLYDKYLAATNAPFSLSQPITAELVGYDFEVSLVQGATTSLVTSATNVVAGDVYLVNGQSNAEALLRDGSANGNQGPYLRSFGINANNGGVVATDLNWYEAEGDLGMNGGPGNIGQWAIRMGRILVDTYSIPVAILNAGDGGEAIGFFQRNDSNPADKATNYGRLLFRAQEARVADGVRSILWYQGEDDFNDGATHEAGFIDLYNDWQVDYPNVERFYVHQLRTGCGVTKWSVDLRNRQRLLADTYADLEVMSTTGLNGHDGCHYSYTNGYETMGTNIFNLVARDLFGSSNTNNIEPPNIDSAYFSRSDRTEVTVVLRNEDDTVTFDAGAEADFRLEGSAVTVTGGTVSSNTLVLALSGYGGDGTGVTYSGHSGAGAWVTNANGVGLLTFFDVPVQIVQLPDPAIINEPASGVGQFAANLNGNLIATGETATAVSVFWGASDGGTDPFGWDDVIELGNQPQGPVSTNLTGLAASTTYYYRYYATNTAGDAWAPDTESFETTADFNTWTYKLKLTFTGYDKGETLTNFPVLVVLNEDIPGFDYDQFSGVRGGDLRFSDSTGLTPLSYDIEEWDPNGDTLVWVRVPELVDNTTFIYAYWGNDGVVDEMLPTDFSDLQLWLKADAGVQTNASGGVTTWADQSGNGRDATAPGGSNPVLDTDAVNSQPAVQFSGSAGEYLESGTVSTWNFLHDGSGCSVFVVYFDQSSDMGTLFATGASATANVGIHVGPRNATDYGLYFSIARGVNGQTTFTENHTSRSDGDFQKGAWGLYQHTYIEGAAPEIVVGNNGWLSFAVDSTRDPSIANSTRPLRLGADNDNFRLNGYLAEVVIYDRVLANDEVEQVGFYLQNKYGLTGAYQDPSAPDAATDGSTWNSEYAGVWHLNEEVVDESFTGVHVNSTPSPTAGLQTGNDDVPALVARGQDFDGDDYIVIGDLMPTGSYTKLAWVMPQDAGERNILSGDTNHVFWAPDSAGGQLAAGHNGVNNIVQDPSALASGEWAQVAVTFDPAVNSGEMVLYRNGEVVDSATSVATHGDSILNFMGRSGDGDYLVGHMDEVRLSSVARGSNWVCAAYLTVVSNAAFSSLGALEGQDAPLVNNDAGAANVTAASADLNGELTWTGAAATEVSVFWGASNGGTDPLNWDEVIDLGEPGVGVLSTNLSGLTQNTQYYYRYYATNSAGEAWADASAMFTTLSQLPAVNNDAGAANITIDSADLIGELTSTGGSPTEVLVFWGPSDGGTDEFSWDGIDQLPGFPGEGVLTNSVSSLAGETRYYYRYYATNTAGDVWADATASFLTAVDFNDFSYRLKVTIDGYDRDEVLTNFPALVVLGPSLPSFRYDLFESDTGGDLRFSDADETMALPYEIEEWNTNGDSYVWVQVPVLTNGACVYAHWGNAAATTPPSYTTDGTTWGTAYKGVWHMGDTMDSSANNIHGVLQGAPVNTSAVIANGYSFDGSGDGLHMPTIAGDFRTFSCWYNRGYTTGGRRAFEFAEGANWLVLGSWSGSAPGNTARTGLQNGGVTYTQDVLPGEPGWHQLVHVWDESALEYHIFVDGLPATTGFKTGGAALFSDRIMRVADTATDYLGLLDEIRIAGVSRSSNWVYATYVNAASNNTFASYGGVEGLQGPAISNDGGASNVTAFAADLNGDLLSTGAAPTEVWVYWGETDGLQVKTNWSFNEYFGQPATLGLLTTNVMNLTEDTTYYYRFYASNTAEGAWAPFSESFTTVRVSPTVSNEPASNIGASSADLNGELVSTGAAAATTWLFYGLSDEGTAKGAWDTPVDLNGAAEGPLSQSVAGLLPDRSYYYRYFSSNSFGEAWAMPTASFTTPSSTLDPNDYGFRTKVTFPGYDKDETLNEFPLLAVLNEGITDFLYSTFASPEGGDLRFTAADGTTVLNYEVEEWNSGGDSFVWVRVPALASNDFVYAYWGNPGAPTAPPYTTDGSTWDSTFELTWHLDETSGNHEDSTANNHDAAPIGALTQDFPGVISGADDFPGGGDMAQSLQVNIMGGLAAVSVHGWFNATNTGGLVFSSEGGYGMYLNSGGVLVPFFDGSSGANPNIATNLHDGVWHHFMTGNDGATTFLYVDGILVGTTPETLLDLDAIAQSRNTSAGANWNGTGNWDGAVDELRFSNVERSSNWVWACYQSQRTGSTFVAFGTVETLGVGPADEDGDGIPDDWELTHCGSTTGCTATAQTGDGDGLTYGEEYVLDYNPAVSNETFVISEAGLGSFNVTFGETTNSRVYTVDATLDLVDSNGWFVVESAVTGSNGVTTVTDPGDADHREYRIRVHVP